MKWKWSVDDESGHSKGEEEFVEGEGDDAYWECEESIYTHTKATNSCEGRTKKANMQRIRSFDKKELNSNQSCSMSVLLVSSPYHLRALVELIGLGTSHFLGLENQVVVLWLTL